MIEMIEMMEMMEQGQVTIEQNSRTRVGFRVTRKGQG